MAQQKHDGERIAMLEERSEYHREQIGALVDAIKDLTHEVTLINRRLARNMGFLGGVAFVFSMLGAVIGSLGNEMMRRLG